MQNTVSTFDAVVISTIHQYFQFFSCWIPGRTAVPTPSGVGNGHEICVGHFWTSVPFATEPLAASERFATFSSPRHRGGCVDLSPCTRCDKMLVLLLQHSSAYPGRHSDAAVRSNKLDVQPRRGSMLKPW